MEQTEHNELQQSTVQSYQAFKNTLDTELKKTAEGFVKIGYLLKVARDTEVLKESGYATVTEFAAAEYGLTKDVVSRYIAINDRYSENGYSEHLQSNYAEYGVAKLAEMLTLPDEVIEQMSPKLTRTEIQEIKKEITEEKQITDIEVMLEPRTDYQNTQDLLEKAIYQYCHDERIIYLALSKAVKQKGEGDIIESLLDVLAPSGFDVKMIRVPGTGKLMLSIGAENNIEVLNIRTNEKASYEWQQLITFLKKFCPEAINEKANWESIYGESFEEKKKEVAEQKQETVTHTPENVTQIPEISTENAKVAPVQPEEQSKDSKSNLEDQLSGQKNIEDYPEYLPDTQATGKEEKKQPVSQEIPQNAPSDIVEQKIYKKGEPRGAITHYIKCSAMFFADAAAGIKNFELRINDRDYRVGDTLHMSEYQEGHNTGRTIKQEIIYMLEEFSGLKEGYCILGTKLARGIEKE